MIRRGIAGGVIVLALSALPAFAGEASCRDFLKAKGEDRALFNGFVYGAVYAHLEFKGDAVINAATAKVMELVTAECTKTPKERVTKVIGLWADVVAKAN